MTAPATEAAPAVQWVCDPTRVTVCRCAAADGDLGETTCACFDKPNIAGNCDLCGAPMCLIDFDTGEPVAAKAVST